ncbi:MAG: hypothetical protein C0417_10460 [Chlorobiaceae bacterium]|nr:hypothetical protein [Chlorobiaceae bacterium]
MNKIRIIVSTIIVIVYSVDYVFSQGYDKALSPKMIGTSTEYVKSVEQSILLNNKGLPKENEIQGINQTTKISTLNLNSNILINIKHPWTDNNPIYRIDADLTNDIIGRDLFSYNVRMDIDCLFDGLASEKAVAFHLDNLWDRIIYARKDEGWIKSFGDNPTDNYKFSEPSGMVVDINDTVYVADAGNHRIVKLYYNKIAEQLFYVSDFRIPDIIRLTDIAIDQSGSLSGAPAADKFWVIDNFTGQLVCFRRSGVIVQRITNYMDGGIYRHLKGVEKIMVQEIPGSPSRLALIDRWIPALVILQPPSNSVISASYFDEIQNRLTCLGLDINNEWWVGDERQRVYHHFTKDGKYIISYSSAGTLSGEFSRPATISNAPYYKLGSTIYRSQYVFTSDKWSSNTGIRAFLPGAAILNPPTNINNNYFSKLPIPFMLTNRSHVKAIITRAEGGGVWKVMKEYDPIIMDANPNAVYYVDNFYLGTGLEFRIKLEYLPAYLDTTNWTPSGSVTIPVYNNVVSTYNLVTIKPVAPTTECTQGNGGTWQVSTLYDGPFTYTWNGSNAETGKTITIPNVCPGTIIKCTVKYIDPGTGNQYVWDGEYTNCKMNVTINGPTSLATGQAGTWYATVNGGAASSTKYYFWGYQPYGSTNWTVLGSNQSVNWTMGSQSIKLRCDVEASSGFCTQSASSTITVRMGTTPTCPYVYTWDGNSFREDNNILPQSEYDENAGKDVTDYYRLLKPLKQKNGKYILQIREFENELSYFDEFKLIAIDHPNYSKIDVAPSSGEVYHYITPYRLNKANIRNNNVLSEIAEFDSSRIIVEPGDTIQLSLQQPTEKSSSFTPQSTLPGGEEGGGDGLPKTQKMAYNAHPNYLSGLDGVLTFRQKPTLVFVPATLDSLKSLNVVWAHRARLDYLNYGVLIPTPYLKRTLPLVSARHSSFADVKEKISIMDSVYALLSPNEFIELQFQSLPSPPAGTKRTFVLYSRGRYEQLSDSSIIAQNLAAKISDFQIDNIYPNPFNPTTKISFQQPTDGYTKIIIYDMIGREVARLADGNISGGMHEVTWDAGNIASGIYFCRYTVTNSIGTVLHQEVKKLILTR